MRWTAARAWSEVLIDLRYLPFLWLVAMAVATRAGADHLRRAGVIVGVWTLDAVVQALSAGTSSMFSGSMQSSS